MPLKNCGCAVAALAAVGALVPLTLAQTSPLKPALAQRCFAQARQLSDEDAGATWGVLLYGPMLLVEPESRRVVANQADPGGLLTSEAGVFVGTLPETVGIANTATEWSGLRWTMLLWPLPTDPTERGGLLMHECFHRVQDELGLPGSNPPNAHLDSADARILIKLEWRALAAALRASGDARRATIQDALIFRARRHELFPSGAVQERELERNEGLAEYTGQRLCGPASEFARRAVANLEARANNQYLARGFAYGCGPAYGALLDELRPEWRSTLGIKAAAGDGVRPPVVNLDFGELLARAAGLSLPADLGREYEARAGQYEGASLIRQERERDAARQRRLAEYRQRFFEAPALHLPLSETVSYTFNPNGMEAYDEHASYYLTLELTDAWGILKSDGGALLIRRDGRLSQARVGGPVTLAGAALSGPGWGLQLAGGWKLVSAEGGGWTVARE